LDKSLFTRLRNTLDKRNFLAHHFWFERCHLMNSEAGLAEMRNELSEVSSIFHRLDAEISEVNPPGFRALGISEEEFAASLEATLAGKPMDPLPSRRPPKKQERLVQVWDVPTLKGVDTRVPKRGWTVLGAMRCGAWLELQRHAGGDLDCK
jgi:hypothetical protein